MLRPRLPGEAAGRGLRLGLDGEGAPAGRAAAAARRADGPDAEAESHALQVLARPRRRGLGRALPAESARFLAAQGFAALRLWVRAVNTGAVALYRGLRAVPGRSRSFAIGAVTLVETAMLWPDLPALGGRD